MANHCIDVICLDCGRAWCLRGCSYYDNGPSQERAAAKLKRMQEWADRFRRGVVHESYYNERCACGSRRVVGD